MNAEPQQFENKSNAYMHRPMSHGVKVRKVWHRQFWLPQDKEYAMIASLEAGAWGMQEVLECIDEWGDWIDG